MMNESAHLCSVCDLEPALAGTLQCSHRFCTSCFTKFIAGSLEELHHHLRCCICGEKSILTRETRGEVVEANFGRERFPKLLEPTGVTVSRHGDFVIPDAGAKRIYVFDHTGHIKLDFGFPHGWELMKGVAINRQNIIIVPYRYGEYTCLGFHKADGSFQNSTYLEPNSTVNGLTVDQRNHVIVADGINSQLIFIDEMRRVTTKMKLEVLEGEHFPACPEDVAVNHDDEILVTDSANHSVRIYDADGNLRKKIGGFGSRPRQFNHPTGISVHKNGYIAICDTKNHRVQYINGFHGDFLHFVARYNQGSDVYIAPTDVVALPHNKLAVLLLKTKNVQAGEIRIYNTTR